MLLLVALVVALPSVQPAFGVHYAAAPIGFVWPLTAVVALLVRHVSAVRQRPFVGFVASSVSVASLLVAAAWGISQSVDCDDRTGQQSHEPQRRNRPDRPQRSLVGAPGRTSLGDPVSSADSSPLRPPGQAWIFSGGAPLAFPPFYGVRSCN